MNVSFPVQVFQTPPASGGGISEIQSTHPMLGVTASGLSALRTKLFDNTSDEYDRLTTLASDIAALLPGVAVVTPYSSLSGATDRQSIIQWGMVNCAFLAMVDPALIRAAGISTPAFTTNSGRTLGSSYTATEIAAVAYDLLMVYEQTHQYSGYNHLPLMDLIANGRVAGVSTEVQHSYSGAGVLTMYPTAAIAYDWCYNLWNTTQRTAVAAKAKACYNSPTYTGATWSTVDDPADSTQNMATTSAYDQVWFIGNQVAWYLCQRVTLYVPFLNDAEYGTLSERQALYTTVNAWLTRLAQESARWGGTGYHHIEALMRYGTDSYTQFLTTMGLTRTAYTGTSPWSYCQDNMAAMPHCLALMQAENERTGYHTVYRMHTMGGDSATIQAQGVPMLELLRGAMLAGGYTAEAEDAQWLIETVGQEPDSEEATQLYRYSQVVLRYGLLWPYSKTIKGASTPTTWRRRHSGGGIVVMGTDPTAPGFQVVVADRPFAYLSGHSDTHACSFGISCHGQIVAFRAPETKGGAFELTNAGKMTGANQILLRDDLGATVQVRSSTDAGHPAPYTTEIVTTQEYARYDPTDYGFVQTDWTHAYDYRTNNFSGCKRFYVVLHAIRVVVVVDLVEGVPTLDNTGTPTAFDVLNRIWVTAEPTWVGGTVTTRSGMTTVNGVPFWRESTDATYWEIDNTSGGAIADVPLHCNGQSETKAKGYITPLLPTTGRSLHARGGADWTVPASPIFMEFQDATDDGTVLAMVASKLPTTEAMTFDVHRDHAWGRLEIRGTGSNQRHMVVYQVGSSDSGDADYVGSYIAVSRLADVGGDVEICLIPHAALPHAVVTPLTVAKVNTDKTYSFVIPVSVTTYVLLCGLPASSNIGVSGSAGGGNVTITVAASGAFTSTSTGTFYFTVTSGGTVTAV